MVEFLMVFALGALTAILGGLLLLPALNARAQRLQRRKLEALYPMSIAEITAERDHVRAEMAVAARRTEIRAEATAQEKAADLAEIGKRDVKIFRLDETLVARDSTIHGLETDLAATRDTLSATEAVRDSLAGELDLTKSALGSLQEAHAALENRHERTDADLSGTRQNLMMVQSSLAAAESELNQKSEALAALTAAHQALHTVASERQMMIAASDARIEILTGEKQELLRRAAEAGDRIAILEKAQREALADADDARSTVSENNGKLDEARAALARLETRQLAQQRAIDSARQQAREDRNAAQAASLALVKAEAEIRRLEMKVGQTRNRAAAADLEPAADKSVTDARVVRMDRAKPVSKSKPPKAAAE